MRTTRYRMLALALALTFVAAACGGDDGGDDGDDQGEDGDAAAQADETSTAAPSTTATIPETGEALVELQIRAVRFGDGGGVTIGNVGADDANVAGVFICQSPTHVDLGSVVDGGTIPAGGTVEIPAATVGGLSEDGGEAALYQGNDFTSADAILAYVQWGSGGARAGVAAEAGIWPDADAAVTPDPEFGGIELFGDPADPLSWG